MNDRKPLVSVIMPAYNAEKYLEEAVHSVIRQTYENWELLILDDCSTDRTRELAEKLAAEPRIRLLRNTRNMGAAQTRNRGFDLARGQWVALLDSDDMWRDDKLEKQLTLAARTGADIIYCSYSLMDEAGGHLSDFLVPDRTGYNEMLRRSVLSCSTVLLRREILAGHRFTGDFYHEDYVLWLELMKAGFRTAGCPQILADYRVARGSRSDNKLRSARNRWLVYRRVEKMPLVRATAIFAAYAWHGLVKHRRVL